MNSETYSTSSTRSSSGQVVQVCQNCQSEFQIEPEDFQFYEKINVPSPTWCSKCRLQRRLAFTNDRMLYKRNCDLCGKDMVASHPPDRDVIVYCNICWWSDNWDSLEYGQDYDTSRPFLEQVKELIRKTPQVALDSNYPTLINSDYVNHCATAKNCYLIFTADKCENVLYSEYLLNNKDSMDSTILQNAELCYWIINGGNSYRIFFCEDCDNCRDVYFSKDCIGCSDCLGCVGLRNKKYHIFNKPYDKEEYAKKIKEYRLDSYKNVESLKKKAQSFWLNYPHKFAHAIRNVNTTGDYVYGAKNVKDMYIVSEGSEDSRYCQLITMPNVKDAYDYTIWGNGAQRIYECMIVGEGADTVKFSFQAWPNVRNIEYSFFAISSSDMLGCANIRNKKYCILNKQYSKKDWEELRNKIIADMDKNPYIDRRGRRYKYGEFFPSELALSGYNESYAMDYFPLTQKEAEQQGFSWYKLQASPHKPTISSINIPDSINEVQDSILEEIIECESCKKPFRIVRNELTLLQSFKLPIPHKCPDCRYLERRSRINPPFLHHRQCMCNYQVYKNTTKHNHHLEGRCPNEFETSYNSKRKEIIYCEACYQQEVV